MRVRFSLLSSELPHMESSKVKFIFIPGSTRYRKGVSEGSCPGLGSQAINQWRRQAFFFLDANSVRSEIDTVRFSWNTCPSSSFSGRPWSFSGVLPCHAIGNQM